MNITLREVPALAAALAAAEEGGLIAALAGHSGSAGDLARKCGLDATACAHILNLFEAFGLVAREGECYRAGSDLIEQARRPIALGRFDAELWRHAPRFLQTGTPLLTMDAAPAEREEIYRDVVADLGAMFAAAADQLAERCGLTPRSILDVGCGSGVWSLAFAHRFPTACVTGLDLSAVTDQFRARAEALGVGDRVTTIEGDMHAMPLPAAQWDLAIIANVLRLEPADSGRSLIKRVAPAIRPGGSLLVIDALAGGTAAAERARAIYALHLAMRTRSSRVHPSSEIAQWMESAGCEAPIEIMFDERYMAAGALAALVAQKIEPRSSRA